MVKRSLHNYIQARIQVWSFGPNGTFGRSPLPASKIQISISLSSGPDKFHDKIVRFLARITGFRKIRESRGRGSNGKQRGVAKICVTNIRGRKRVKRLIILEDTVQWGFRKKEMESKSLFWTKKLSISTKSKHSQ